MHAPNVWLVTGSSGGFGSALVKSVLARGDRVIATARSLDKIPSDFPNTDALRLLELDITAGEKTIREIMKKAVGFWGRIDVLVNNAGFGAKVLVEEGGSGEMRRQFEVNWTYPWVIPADLFPQRLDERLWDPGCDDRGAAVHAKGKCTGSYSSSKAALRVFSETLAAEIAPFSIRMLIVEPAAFRTDALIKGSVYRGNLIPDYDEMREAAVERYRKSYEMLRGDPRKAMEAVVDVVRGEGGAEGRAWPMYLILGDSGVSGVTEKCDRILGLLDEWRDVSTGLDFDPEEGRRS